MNTPNNFNQCIKYAFTRILLSLCQIGMMQANL